MKIGSGQLDTDCCLHLHYLVRQQHTEEHLIEKYLHGN